MRHKNNKNIFKSICNKKTTSKFSKTKDFFLRLSDMPNDVLNNITKITIIDDFNVLIEGYKNVEEYYTHYIKIIGNKNEIIIDGMNLDIDEINNENLLIKGKIISINFKEI